MIMIGLESDFSNCVPRRGGPRETGRRPHPAVAGCGALALVALLVACAPTGSDVEPTPASPTDIANRGASAKPGEEVAFGTLEEFQAEYARAAADMSESLPSGWTLPELPPGEWDSEGRYERGYGDITLAFIYQCAWSNEYLNAQEAQGTERASEALDALEAWVDLAAVQDHVDEDSRKHWLSEVMKPLQSADSTQLSMVAEGCL